ncbi:MAG: hypothetical protein H6815_04925 [Phycisphaeraceae bacterium]|nr:hypothetical protein [Phycisphaerales bacterium]MCB9859778.1 hypothetical protein [Phycisphaeraceae bacterium]
MAEPEPKQSPVTTDAATFGDELRSKVLALEAELAKLRARVSVLESGCVDRAARIEQMLTHRRARHARKLLNSQGTPDVSHG